MIVVPNIFMNRFGGGFIDDVLTIPALTGVGNNSMIGGSERLLQNIRHWRSYHFRDRCHFRVSVCVVMAVSMVCRLYWRREVTLLIQCIDLRAIKGPELLCAFLGSLSA